MDPSITYSVRGGPPRIALVILISVFLAATQVPTLNAQEVEDTLMDPAGDLVVLLPPTSSQEVNLTEYLGKTFLDITNLTLLDYPDYKEVVVETVSPLDIGIIESGKLEITIPIDYNGDSKADDLAIIVGGIGKVVSPAALVKSEEGQIIVLANLSLTLEGNKLVIQVQKQSVPPEYSGAWAFPRITSDDVLVMAIYEESTTQGRVYVIDNLGPSTSVTTPALNNTVETVSTTTTATAVVTIETTETSPQPYPPALSDLLGTEPTDPNLQVSVEVARLEVYQYFEDGLPYVALWMEATLSAPDAQDLEVHMIVEYVNGTRDEGTIIPGLVDMASLLNQDPAYGVVFREWDPTGERGGLIALIPASPGDYSQARLLFGYIGPRENPRTISDVSKVYVVVLAYRDKQAGLWNVAVDETHIRVLNAEPPDNIKDMIEEGKGLPVIPPLHSTTTATTITANTSMETTATTLQAVAEEAEEYEHGEEMEEAPTMPGSTSTAVVSVTVEHEEGEEEENEVEKTTVQETGEEYGEEAEETEEAEAEEGENGEGESMEGGEGEEAEGEEGEGANLPTREIAIAIVIAAVGGVVLSFVKKK